MEELPGIDALFREHKRLSCKLTVDELRAIRDYIDERLNHEQYNLYFQLASLQNDFDITLRKSSEAITGLQLELNEKNEVLKHYKNSDENIINVHRQREAKWEKKQELLLAEVEKLDDECSRMKARLELVEKDLERKCKEVTELEAKVEEAKQAVQTVDEAKQVLEQRDKTTQDILKMKLEIDKRDRVIKSLEGEQRNLKQEIERFKKEKELNDVKVASMQKELRKQVAEVASKCKDLSQLQFQLQLEKRQAVTLQKQMKTATEDVQNYKRMLMDKERPRDPFDTVVVTIKKDLDMTDVKIRALDVSIKTKVEAIKESEKLIEMCKHEENLAVQIKSEVYLQGDSFLEKTVMELVNKLEEKRKKLNAQLKTAQMWTESKKEAEMLTKEISALQQQAEINRLTDLAKRAAKQVEKVDSVMKHTAELKVPRIFKVSAKVKTISKTETDHEKSNIVPKVPLAKTQSVFLTSTPNNQYVDNNYVVAMPTFKTRKLPRDKINTARSLPAIGDEELGSTITLQSLSGSQIDLSLRTGSNVRGNRSVKSPVTNSTALHLPEVSLIAE